MIAQSDALETPALEGPDRLAYQQGTLLDSGAFSAEQAYHRGRLARSLQYLFGPGTIAGLSVTWHAPSEEIVVQPGLAVDPLGRLIEIPKAKCLHLRDWFRKQRAEDLRDSWIDEAGDPRLIADVFVRFRVTDAGTTQAFAQGAFDATNGVVSARLRDDFEIGLALREEAGARRLALDAGTTPVPVIPVPDLDETLLSLPPGDLGAIHTRILDLWRDAASDWLDGRPPRLREHLQPRISYTPDDFTQIGRDPTALLLCRARIPVLASDAQPLPTEPADITPELDNDLRRFVYALGHLTQPAVRGVGP